MATSARMHARRCRAAGIEVAGCDGTGGETSLSLDVITAEITAERERAGVRERVSIRLRILWGIRGVCLVVGVCERLVGACTQA